MSAYQTLESRFQRINALREAAGMLHWDMSTLMPAGGAEARSEQLAALDVTSHELLCHEAMAELFQAAESNGAELDPWQAANLREMARDWRHATALDSDLVAALARAGSRCEMAWREARPAADFGAVLPVFKELLALVRESAAAKGAALGCSPYDALLDLYEPGASAQAINRLFDDLAGFLPGFIAQVIACQASEPAPLEPEGPFPRDRQEALGRRLMEVVGFDFAHGRLDVSLHPFCGGVPDDIRITTRYEEDDFDKAMMAVLHETGHALYERGLPAKWRLQPVGAARGMGFHESQSLLIEMQACRGRDFMGFVAPLVRTAFDGSGPAWAADNLYRRGTRVQADFIRVYADEVTYPAHVILRSRLEQALIAGDLAAEDLPAAWNEAMGELLGITPPDDGQGCLQDIHWFDGAFGYFPTYTIGAMTAAQLFAAARQARPEIPEALGRGDFAPLIGWLAEKVHAKGSLLSGEALLSEATGRPLDPAVFKAHLESRYLGS